MIMLPVIAVILPAYNEEKTIAETIASFVNALPEAAIIVINNNSSDRTRDCASEALSRLGTAGGVIDEYAQGKGNALRCAFREVEADIYLIADGDLTYPANRARDLIKPILDGKADMVVGDRHTGGHYARENHRKFHKLGNSLVQKLVNILFGSNLSDIMSGYRAISKSFVKSYPIFVEGFQIETDMTLHALYRRFRILEIPIEYRDRPFGSYSKLNTISDGIRVLFAITQILRFYKPLQFFLGLSILFAFSGLLASVPVFEDWFTTGYIEHLPLAILASGLEIIAILMFSVGLILDSVAYHDRLEYERYLLNSGHIKPKNYNEPDKNQ